MSKSQTIVSGLTHVDLGWKKTAEEMEEVFEDVYKRQSPFCIMPCCFPAN